MRAIIAVIIPTFKPGNYLQRCIESLNNQIISKNIFTVYICLNGPKYPFYDFINEIISQYPLLHIKLTYTCSAGVSNARNVLIEESNEEFITFIDDDDLVSDNYLLDMLSVSGKNHIGIGNVLDFTSNPNESKDSYISKCYNILKREESNKFRARKYFSSPHAKIIHRSMIGNNRFDTKLKNGEDAFFMALISKNVAKIIKSPNNPCYYYYIRPGSASRKKIALFDEIKRISYLQARYIELFLDSDYDKFFILSRIFATFVHLKNKIFAI